MPFNEKQVRQLLQPINPSRVLRDGKGQAHVPAFDVIAHMNRLFGFGNWDSEVTSLELMFEEPGSKAGRWNTCFKALVKLTIRDENGQLVCSYEDGSMGSALNQTRADALDLAMKSAISTALKRAAKNLGDQTGLSLYDKGRMSSVVKATLVGLPEEGPDDVQSDVEQVMSIGVDETHHDVVPPPASPADAARDELRQFCTDKGLDLRVVAAEFAESGAGVLRDADADSVLAFLNLLKSGVVTVG